MFNAAAAPATGRPAGRSIEFSGAEDDTVSTNALQAARRAEALKQVEKDLRAPMSLFSFEESSESLPPPAAYRAPRPPSKQALEQMERKKNWMLLTPEELLLGRPEDDPLQPSGPAKTQPAKPSRREDYYFGKSSNKPATEGAPWLESERNPWRARTDDPALREETDAPAGVKASEQALRNAVLTGDEERPLLSPSQRGNFSDIFHVGDGPSPADERAALHHKALMRDYSRAIGLPEDLSPRDSHSARSLETVGPARPGAEVFGFRPKSTDQPNPLSPAYGKLLPLPPGAPQTGFGSTSLLPTTTLNTDQAPSDPSPPKPTFMAPRRPFL